MRKVLVLAVVALAAVTVTVAAHGSTTKSKQVVVSTRNVKGLGTILVNAQGRTLYMFVPDKQKKVTCMGVCAQVWPPLKAAKGDTLVAKGAAQKKLLGMDKNPSGGYVVTYAKWPLYTYVSDTKPGDVTGQGLNSTGGLWYVLSPAGKVIKTRP